MESFSYCDRLELVTEKAAVTLTLTTLLKILPIWTSVGVSCCFSGVGGGESGRHHSWLVSEL